MNFTKAYEKLLSGEKIRRREWEPYMHLCLKDGEVKTYKGEFTNFYEGANILIKKGWMIFDGDGKQLSFPEMLDELKLKRFITNAKWPKDHFIFVDKDQIVMSKPIEVNFMPTWKCMCSDDWIILK